MKKKTPMAMLVAILVLCLSLTGGFQAFASELHSLAGTYVYNEHISFGGQQIDSVWTLTLSEDGTYRMETEIMGRPTTLTGTYTEKDAASAQVTTGTPTEGAPSMVVFFNADGSCDWQLYQDGSCEPLSAGIGIPSAMPGGLPGGMPNRMNGGTQSSADYPNVAYASNSTSQVMDIYLPENATGHDPALVVVHGGGFKFGSQTMDIIQPIIEAGVKNGYVVASVDYRKSGEAVFPGALSDVKASVRFLRANADEYGIDSEKIVIWGESAGAYLADMTALTSSVAVLNGDVTDNADFSSTVSAMVSFYAPVEFYTMDEEFISLGDSASANHSQNSFETDYLGIPDMTADKEAVYKSWWGTYRDSVPADLKVWIQAGTADTNVPYTQSQNLAEGLENVLDAGNVHFGLLEGAAHEDTQFYTDENLAAVFAFLADALQ